MKAILVIAAALTAASAFAAPTNDCSKEDHFPLITKSELKEVAKKKSALIIDVNSADSFKKSHVPGAISYETHQNDFAMMLPPNKNALIVAYCGGPQCTAWHKAAEKACQMGYTNIKHFKDGISGWNNASLQ